MMGLETDHNDSTTDTNPHQRSLAPAADILLLETDLTCRKRAALHLLQPASVVDFGSSILKPSTPIRTRSFITVSTMDHEPRTPMRRLGPVLREGSKAHKATQGPNN